MDQSLASQSSKGKSKVEEESQKKPLTSFSKIKGESRRSAGHAPPSDCDCGCVGGCGVLLEIDQCASKQGLGVVLEIMECESYQDADADHGGRGGGIKGGSDGGATDGRYYYDFKIIPNYMVPPRPPLSSETPPEQQPSSTGYVPERRDLRTYRPRVADV